MSEGLVSNFWISYSPVVLIFFIDNSNSVFYYELKIPSEIRRSFDKYFGKVSSGMVTYLATISTYALKVSHPLAF